MRAFWNKNITLINYVFATGLFGFYGFSIKNHDIIGALSLLFIVFFGFNAKLKTYKKFKPLLIGLLSLVIIDIIVSHYSYNQSIIYSLRAVRLFLIAIPLVFLFQDFVVTRSNNKLVSKRFILIISLIIIVVHYYVFLTNNLTLIKSVEILTRFGSARFLISSGTVLFLILFFSQNKTKLFSIENIMFILLLGIILFISKTRAIILALILLFVLKVLYKIYKKNVKYLFQVLILSSIIFILFNKPILEYYTIFTDYLEEDIYSDKGNVSIRNEALVFYFDKMENIDFVFGRGIENKLVSKKYEERLTLADIGLFKVIYNHGVIGLVLVVSFFVSFYRKSRQDIPLHKTIRMFIILQFLMSPTIILLYDIEGLFINLFLYTIVTYDS